MLDNQDVRVGDLRMSNVNGLCLVTSTEPNFVVHSVCISDFKTYSCTYRRMSTYPLISRGGKNVWS
jgi:hypothetical protein